MTLKNFKFFVADKTTCNSLTQKSAVFPLAKIGKCFALQMEFLYMSMKMLSIAVDKWLLILVGKSTMLYRLYDAKRESN